MIFREVAQMATAFLSSILAVAYITGAAVVFGLVTHERWYSCLEFGAVVVLGVWGFGTFLAACQKELTRNGAWLALMTLAKESQEFEKLKTALSSRNLDDVMKASETIRAAIRDNQ
jgi:cytochrome c biogenesis protein CcdA